MRGTLQLADGQSWTIRASGHAGAWGDELAFAMGLAESGQRGGAVMRIEAAELPGPGRDCRWEPPAGYPDGGWLCRHHAGMELLRRGAGEDVICRLSPSSDRALRVEQMRLAMFPIYESAVRKGGLPIHAALLEHDGKGVLLSGRSGAGKTTACGRVPPEWSVLADDLALVVRDGKGVYHAHSLPTWSALKEDRSLYPCRAGRSVPLCAFFFIEQAGEDAAVPAGNGAASVMIDASALAVFRSVDCSCEPVKKSPLRKEIFLNAASMALAVPSWVLQMSLAGRFWEKIEEALQMSSANS